MIVDPGHVTIPWALIDALGPKELPTAVVVCAIAGQADLYPRGSGWVSMSVRELAEFTHLTDPQVRRALDLAIDVGVLERRASAGGDVDGPGRRTYAYRAVVPLKPAPAAGAA